MRFRKENHATDQREGTETIVGTEPNNQMKYREEIDNALEKKSFRSTKRSARKRFYQ